MATSSYVYYNNLFKTETLPLAFCDLDLLNENIRSIIKRASGTNKTIRVATKSIRCVEIIRHILQSNSVFQGLMSFCGTETLFLVENGFDDILIGYPIVHEQEIREICKHTKAGKKIYLMADSLVHLELINTIAQQENVKQAICMDMDMSTQFPGVYFGVLRSPLNTIEKAKQFIDSLPQYPNIELKAIMGYEAQIAGLGDKNPTNGLKNLLIPTLKKKSITDFTNRRKSIVDYLHSKGLKVELVNAGGTGSIESSKTENWVTEITVGSGFFSPALFDYYAAFKHQPAVGFAVPIVRSPQKGYFTCLGGGYVASGTTGKDKQPMPYLPNGIELTENEGCGEVQTPFKYSGSEKLQIGDTVLFRHAKAGELCERFNTLCLISNGKIIDNALTYRGMGMSFL